MNASLPEHEKVRSWREAHYWSLDDLVQLTGYSYSSLYWFEKGMTPKGKPIDSYVWYRFKRVCHSVHLDVHLGQQPIFSDFNWDPST